MKKSMKKAWKPAMVLLLLLIIWEAAGNLFAIPDWLLPAPSQIWQAGVEGWSMYQHHLLSTIKLSIIGFLIGTSIGIVVAVCLHLMTFVREAFFPLMILSQNIPIIVLAPLLVVWFGFGMLPKIIVITLVCFFPVAVACMDGFRRTDHNLIHYLEMAGASRSDIFRKLDIPSALPSFFSGLKISGTYSVMGAVISEWLGADEGIGVYMTLASSSFRTDRVFVAIGFVMLMSLLFFLLIAIAENRILKWKFGGE